MLMGTMQSLAHTAADAAAEKLGWQGAFRLERVRFVPSSYSDVLQLHLIHDRDAKIVWVKAPRITSDNADLVSDRINTEFKILSRLHHRYSHCPGLDVIKPLAVVNEPLALITEDTPGATLKRVMTTSGRFPAVLWKKKELEALCQRTGEWLRMFHEETQIEPAETNWDDTLAYCEHRLRLLLQESGSEMTNAIANRIRRYLSECINSVSRSPGPLAGRHNDFAGHNIVVTPSRGISVLDFSMFDYDSIAFDCYSFIHHLEAFRFDPLYGARTVDQLVAAFIAGYGESFPRQEPLRDIVYCRLSLAKLLTHSALLRKHPVRQFLSRQLKRAYMDWLHAFANGRPC